MPKAVCACDHKGCCESLDTYSYNQGVMDAIMHIKHTDLPIDIEHWMETKKHLTQEVCKAMVEELKRLIK